MARDRLELQRELAARLLDLAGRAVALMPTELVASAMFTAGIELLRRERDAEHVAQQLELAAEAVRDAEAPPVAH